MTSRFPILLLALSLVGCFPDAVNDLDNDKGTDEGGGTLGGAAFLAITSAGLDNSDYPIAVKATIIASAGSQYELKLGNKIVETGNMPIDPKPQGPFSGISDGNNERLVYFVISKPGRHTVTLTEAFNGDIETDMATLAVGNICVENTEFYDNESAIGPSTFAGCINCHGNGTASFTIDGSSYATVSTVTKIAPPKSNNYFGFAHTPANLDRTPFGNGGEFSHSDGRKWNPDSATH